MTIPLAEFHTHLRLDLPCTERDITTTLDRLHKALPRAYGGYPRGAAEVADAMKQLAIAGLCEKRGPEWWWLPVKAAKVMEPTLF